MFLSHGGRPTKGNGRKRKGVDEYAAENRVDFTSRSIIRDGQLVRILVCRFCCQSIGARSDRIKEHLASKRHQKLKLEAFREAAEAGRDLTQEYSDDSVSGLLPEPPITMLKFPGKALAHLLEGGGDGRHVNREMTPEAEDRKPVIPLIPPPLKERMSSPPPQSLHPGVGLHGGLQSSGGSMSNMSGGRLSSGPNSAGTPPPQHPQQQQQQQTKEPLSPPQQLLCVRWGNFDSNIVSMFTKLRSQEHFVDVTLWCEGKTIKCHKMILSACSTYFEKLLTENPNPHPIIFLKDMRFWEITALVEFMYRGEVSIHQEKLQSLLRAAESLQIKGLGSPSANDGSAVGAAGASLAQQDTRDNSGLDDELSNGTMDMSTNNNSSSSHNPSLSNHSTLSALHNHINNSSSIHGNLSNLSHQPHHLHNNSSSPHSLLNSMNMGMDLSNHGSALGLSNVHSTPLPLPLSLSSALNNNNNNNNNNSGVIHAKRRKKETPRRLDIPRANLPVPVFNSTMASDNLEDDVDDNASDDSMAAHERNHVDAYNKQDVNPEIGYDEEEEGQENYGENDPGSQMEDDRSDSEHCGGDLDEDMDNAGGGGHHEETDESGALSLRVTSAAERERLERERSRKGNPIKKIHLGNINNNNEGTTIIHNTPSAVD